MMKRLTVMKATSIIGVFFLLLTANLAHAGGGAHPLKAPAGAKGAGHNDEGIKFYKDGMWEKAELHFSEAAKENNMLAEAHYNLALALDKQGRHREATKHFAGAHKMGKNNPEIANSKILKKHLGM